MTRIMLDALYPLSIPSPQPAGVLIAAYVGHNENPASYTQAMARFPGHQVVSIAAKTHHDAQILDIEHGAVEPNDTATINDWCMRQRARGVTPTLYASESDWLGISGRVVGSRNWWAANWSNGPTIPPSAVGIQYVHLPGYDMSVMLNYIPGVDPAPVPPAPPPAPVPPDPPAEDDDMYGLPHIVFDQANPARAIIVYPSGRLFTLLDPVTSNNYKSAGSPVVGISTSDFDALFADANGAI